MSENGPTREVRDEIAEIRRELQGDAAFRKKGILERLDNAEEGLDKVEDQMDRWKAVAAALLALASFLGGGSIVLQLLGAG